ncbi:atypical/ABC1/ABC1-A protein kinase Abc1 [Schizosaccharomyces japonicus yFS275]|uniref:Atypical/ABC1/ABC1-A protein kinase Abc1 n=1 Tax=Schizosaccharomyces japonicus (strain yFS275 / FY16936) TaxID=402676 RepID=B6JX07_SCHJY|nr:atypical/ABC1/ABC1-A protein kinase Abc1 [Schizosaccharomyces japonicus yFS275]EEB05908.1 atypical/ABC1/ABC1-A protein kinase Abc1 [Schizosaccharomyces japonicus yFS275]
MWKPGLKGFLSLRNTLKEIVTQQTDYSPLLKSSNPLKRTAPSSHNGIAATQNASSKAAINQPFQREAPNHLNHGATTIKTRSFNDDIHRSSSNKPGRLLHEKTIEQNGTENTSTISKSNDLECKKDKQTDGSSTIAPDSESPKNKTRGPFNETSAKERYFDEDNEGNEEEPKLKPSKVPSSQVSRLFHYGGLAASLSAGAVSEKWKRFWGSSKETGASFLSRRNTEVLVNKLTQMRGAALKLGQMVSFQDSDIFPKGMSKVLERVRDGAHYMPDKQLERVMQKNLGPDWLKLFSDFQRMPIAAASIGQVHKARLASSNALVAVKVQYPGIDKSIDSDLSNLSMLLTASKLLPKGLFLEESIREARRELKWECDYKREAACAERFHELLQGDPNFKVPRVFREASGPTVLTLEYLHGQALGKQKLPQKECNRLGTLLMHHCLREIADYHFMQTDPNWSNFLYNEHTRQLELLDFGASREYDDKFVDRYCRLLLAAAKRDFDTCRRLSVELGYLNKNESSLMIKAHIESLFTLAEPFADDAPEVFDFRTQTITERIKAEIPVMLKLRLQPPPEQTYSLHRRLSGHFLLCAKLGAQIRCRKIFYEVLKKYDNNEH